MNIVKYKSLSSLLLISIIALFVACWLMFDVRPALSAEPAITLDTRYQEYTQVPGISGTIKSIGSDTLNNVMTFWAEDFRKTYPGVKIEIEGKGSSTAPPALIAGTAQFGPMSREMKPQEIDAFTNKYGYGPLKIQVGVDALAVFVHKDNPISCLSLNQLDSIFSITRTRGGQNITKWKDVGVTDPRFADKTISLFGRNSASGTYGYFKEVALANGDFKPTVKEQPGSSAVIQGISADVAAIGYSGIGYKTADVKILEISGRDGICMAPTQNNVYMSKYPIARFLFVYVNKNPSTPFDPLRREFIRFILSKQGQRAVIKDGYYPLPFIVAKQTSLMVN